MIGRQLVSALDHDTCQPFEVFLIKPGMRWLAILGLIISTLGCGGGGSGTSAAPQVIAPSIVMQPTNQTVSQNQSGALSVTASGTAPLSYVWKKDGVVVSGAFASTLTFVSAQPSDSGSYVVTVSNSAGSVSSSPAILTVSPLPVISQFSAAPPLIPIGGGSVLSWDVTGADSLQIDHGIGTLGSGKGTRNVTPSTTTRFTLAATNAAGTSQATADVTVDPTPFQITSLSAAPSPTTFGGTSQLAWTYAGLPLSLSLNGNAVTGLSAQVSPVRRQMYTLSGMNGAGSDSRSVSVGARGLDLVSGNLGGLGFLDGPGARARFNTPQGVAVGPAGTIYIADTRNHVIRVLDPSGVVSTLAGLAGTSGSSDGVGAVSRFNLPNGLALDASGNLFVADSGNNTIRKISTSGMVSTIAGTAGVPGGLDGTGSAARFYSPIGIVADSAGNLFVTDTYNATIRKITSAGVVTTLAGAVGATGTTDGPSASARFGQPCGIALDASGNLFVADAFYHTIRKIDAAGTVSTYAGTAGAPGSLDGPATTAQFRAPFGICLDAGGNVLVADGQFGLIRKITPSGVVSTLAGALPGGSWVDGTGNAARFYLPALIAMMPSGNLIVADAYNHAIRNMTTGNVVSTLAGSAAVTGWMDGTGASAQFSTANGIALDASGNAFVSDYNNHTIRKVTPAGAVTTLAGAPMVSGSQDGNGSTARFNKPFGLAVAPSGSIYVADSGNQVIRKITASGDVSTFAGSAGTSGSVDGTGTGAQFYGPVGLATDGSGNLYVTDCLNHTIRKVTPAGVVTTVAGSPGTSGSNDGPVASAHFNFPRGLAVDASGTLYVADSANHVIRKVIPGGLVTTLAGSPGAKGFADGTGLLARFNSPNALSIDATGNLFVTDSLNHSVRKITPSGEVTTVAGTPTQWGFYPGLLPGYLDFPNFIVVTSDGDLLVTMLNGIVQVTAP